MAQLSLHKIIYDVIPLSADLLIKSILILLLKKPMSLKLIYVFKYNENSPSVYNTSNTREIHHPIAIVF